MKNISSIPITLGKKYWPIILVVVLALFLRLFKISSYMTFLGDEGRDALVWLRMLHGKLTLIGPQTSIGNMYLGPLYYYYLMFPFYLVLGTVGPSVGVALFAGGTTFLLWFCGRVWFSEKVGLLAAFLYAISPVAIELSRSSWNPNVMPFFALLVAWGVWQFWQEDNFKWLMVIGACLSFAVQSHYLGILLVFFVGIYWFLKIRRIRDRETTGNKNKLRRFLLYSFLAGFIFVLLTILPLVWFDLRHGFINYHSFYKFFSERQTTVNFRAYKAFPNLWPLWKMLVSRLVTAKDFSLGAWVSLAGGGFVVWALLRSVFKKRFIFNKGAFLVFSWIALGLLGMGLYKQHIYDHYFGFLFPAVFLLTAFILNTLWQYKKAGKIISFVFLLVLVVYNLKQNPLLFPPNNQMNHTAEVSRAIVGYSGGKPFNLGMIAKQNYDAGYRYFLEKWGERAVEIDAQRADETITDQLFVVCEIQDCQPIGHSQAEIANFGWAEIENQWQFPWGVKLYRLVHYQE